MGALPSTRGTVPPYGLRDTRTSEFLSKPRVSYDEPWYRTLERHPFHLFCLVDGRRWAEGTSGRSPSEESSKCSWKKVLKHRWKPTGCDGWGLTGILSISAPTMCDSRLIFIIRSIFVVPENGRTLRKRSTLISGENAHCICFHLAPFCHLAPLCKITTCLVWTGGDCSINPDQSARRVIVLRASTTDRDTAVVKHSGLLTNYETSGRPAAHAHVLLVRAAAIFPT